MNHQTNRIVRIVAGGLVLGLTGIGAPLFAEEQRSVCPVTLPQKRLMGLGGQIESDALEAILLPENFVFIKRPPSSGSKENAALRVKFAWNRKRLGELTIEGRRLDKISTALQSHVPVMSSESGFQASSLIFPEPGCWEVTGRLANDKLTFVVLVMEITGS